MTNDKDKMPIEEKRLPPGLFVFLIIFIGWMNLLMCVSGK
jgi:hypothetical protein